MWMSLVRNPVVRLSALRVALVAGCLALGFLAGLARAHEVKPAQQSPCTCPNVVPAPEPNPTFSTGCGKRRFLPTW